MGEYADDGIDRDYGNFCDYKTGTGIYGEDSEIYDLFDKNELDFGEDIPVIKISGFEVLDFENVVKESEKAWLLKFDKNNVWCSKKYCRIKDNKVMIPKWLYNKMDI